MRLGTSIGFLAGIAILASTAQADLLNLWPQNPDITSSFITVSYNSGTDQFNANGTATQLVDELNNVYNITGGSFALNATIDGTGAASAGSLSIGGNVNGDGPSLLTQIDLARARALGLITEEKDGGAVKYVRWRAHRHLTKDKRGNA